MAKKNDDGSRWQGMAQDGRLATGAWAFTFLAYLGFRVAKIDAPELTNAFVTITGIWVGNLGIAQSKKTARIQEHAAIVEEKVDKLKKRADKNHPEEIRENEEKDE